MNPNNHGHHYPNELILLGNTILQIMHDEPTEHFDQDGFLPVHYILDHLTQHQQDYFNSAVASLLSLAYVEDEVSSPSPTAFHQYRAEYWLHINELTTARTLHPHGLRLTPDGRKRAIELATIHTHSSGNTFGGIVGGVMLAIILLIGGLLIFNGFQNSTSNTNDCSLSPAQQIQPNTSAVVCTSEDSVLVRETTSTKSQNKYTLSPGDHVDIIGGPTCAEHYRWWEVQTADRTQGWVREGKDQKDTYFICPVTQ